MRIGRVHLEHHGDGTGYPVGVSRPKLNLATMRQARVPSLPYHRVIAAGGQLGGYSDLSLKRALLVAEGLVVSARRVRHFEKVRWP